MVVYVSILRGINVGGHNRIKMADLKVLYETLDFTNVRTLIQSGNVVFNSNLASPSELEARINDEIRIAFNFNVMVFIRTINELKEIIEHNPFCETYEDSKIHITFLSDCPKSPNFKVIDEVKDQSEEFRVSGREIYLFLPNGYGRTKLSNNFFENKLNVNCTTRNWRTVKKLFEMAESEED